MKDTYTEPTLEIFVFQTEDVITESPKELKPLG